MIFLNILDNGPLNLINSNSSQVGLKSKQKFEYAVDGSYIFITL